MDSVSSQGRKIYRQKCSGNGNRCRVYDGSLQSNLHPILLDHQVFPVLDQVRGWNQGNTGLNGFGISGGIHYKKDKRQKCKDTKQNTDHSTYDPMVQ